MRPLRILFVARPYSVHTARWINQVADLGWDLHLFPSSESPLHPDYRNITTYYFERDPRARLDQSVRTRVLWPLPFAGSRVRLLANHLPPAWADRAEWLARVIRRIKPDIVHALEFQEAGYLIARTKPLFSSQEFPPLVVSNWGSDIFLYGPRDDHTDRVKAVLANADYYTCECHRDVGLTREYGFKGEVLPVLPVAGGFNIEEMRRHMQPGPTSDRRTIALKGYQHWSGRGLVALRALELCAGVLKAEALKVVVYAVNNAEVKVAVERMTQLTGIDVEILPPGTHEDMLRLHGRARISVGLSISDGLSTSALEAVVMGSFPVQSNTSCLCEIVPDGEGALMVPPEDPEAVAAAIRRAATDDALVDAAAEANARVAFARLSQDIIRPQVIDMYQRIARARQ